MLAVHGAGGLKPLQHLLEDIRFSTSVRSATDTLLIVQIDPKSLSELGRWPWPRGLYAEMLDRLHSSGASDIAFDVDFSSPSQPQDDEKLREALIRAGGAVILPAFKQASFAADGSNAPVATVPLQAFAEQAWIASVNVQADSDGKVRRIAVSDSLLGQTAPALAVMMAGFTFEDDFFRVDYGIDPGTIDFVSVVDVLRGSVLEERIRGRKVIIGATAIELRDFVLVVAIR